MTRRWRSAMVARRPVAVAVGAGSVVWVLKVDVYAAGMATVVLGHCAGVDFGNVGLIVNVVRKHYKLLFQTLLVLTHHMRVLQSGQTRSEGVK